MKLFYEWIVRNKRENIPTTLHIDERPNDLVRIEWRIAYQTDVNK